MGREVIVPPAQLRTFTIIRDPLRHEAKELKRPDVVRSMEYSSLPGEKVLDLFGGSGSTLIGCEQTGRKAFLMKLDPMYCDVIVQRWEKSTDRKVERIAAGDVAEVTA